MFSSPTSLRTRANAWVYTYRLELTIVVLALAFRLLMIGIAPHQALVTYWLGFDGADYVNEAQNILDGHGFSRSTESPYAPDALRTPLYPLALAGAHLLTGSFVTSVLFAAFFSSLIPLFGIAMAHFFVRNRRVLWALGLFLAFEPHLAFATTFFGTEVIAVVLTTWGVYEILAMVYGERPRRHAILAGVAFGFATLAHPTTLYLPLFLAPLFIYQGYTKQRIRKLTVDFGVFITIFALVLSPWIARNYLVFDSISLSSASWFNAYTRFAATVRAVDTGEDFYTSFQELLDNLSVRGYVHHSPPVSELEIEDPQFSGMLRYEAIRVVSEHPRALPVYLSTAVFSVLTQSNLLGYASALHPFHYPHPTFSPTLYASQHGVLALAEAVAPYLFGPYIVPYLMRALFTCLFLFSCGGAWLLWRRGEHFATLFLFGLIVYFAVLSTVAGAQITDRYRAPFLSGETVLAAVALDRLVTLRRMRRSTLPA